MALSSVVGGFRLKIKGSCERQAPSTDINHHFFFGPNEWYTNSIHGNGGPETVGETRPQPVFLIKELFGICQESQTK